MADDPLLSSTSTTAEGLRSRAWHCLRSSHHLRTSQKLALLQDFLHAFSRLDDVEGQLVLRYEILCLRESCDSAHEMKVDASEWSSFAEDCLSAGFPGNASKAFEKARLNVQDNQTTNVEPHYERWSCLTSEHNDGFNNGSPLSSFCENSATIVSRFSEGLKRKERAKLQMLQSRNIYCMD